MLSGRVQENDIVKCSYLLGKGVTFDVTRPAPPKKEADPTPSRTENSVSEGNATSTSASSNGPTQKKKKTGKKDQDAGAPKAK